MSELAVPCISPEEYLAIERVAEFRSEYFAGKMYAMPGVKRPHSLIVTELIAALHSGLRGRDCEIHAQDMRVRVPAAGLYTYPDVAVVCGEARYEDDEVDTLLNPDVIIEVLSPSTELYDRVGKFKLYRGLESLREYVLVAQYEPDIEKFTRRPDGTWSLTAADDLTANITLESIGVTLELADIYSKVKFAPRTQLRAIDTDSR